MGEEAKKWWEKRTRDEGGREGGRSYLVAAPIRATMSQPVCFVGRKWNEQMLVSRLFKIQKYVSKG